MDTETTQKEKQPKKKSIARRIVKGILWFLGGLIVFVLLAVLTLPLWINPVATSLANALVPKYTDTAFNLDRVNLNPYTGKLLIAGVKLANPEGYAVPDAFTLGSISAEVEVASLLSDTIHVREVTVDALSASWVFDAGGSNNIDRIMAAVNEKLGPKEEKEEEPSEKKVVVDKVTVKNVRAFVGTAVFDLESLTLADFGKDTPAKLAISGVRLTNPPGFEAESAFSLGSFSIGVETGDLGKLPIRIHDIVIDSPYASYVFDEKNVDNFTRMLEPILAKGGAAEEKPENPAAAKKDEKKPEESAGSPVTLDRLEVKNIKAQICKGRFELASLVVNDFGKPRMALVRLEGVKLVNPEGFKQPNAFSLRSLSVGLETADLSKKPMVLHDIVVDSPYASYVFDEKNVDNFTRMLEPLLAKDGEAKEEPKEKGEAKKDEKEKVESSGTPIVLDRLEVKNLKTHVCNGRFEFASLVVTDFGKPTSALVRLEGVELTNPDGFAGPDAFSLKSLSVGMETADLSKKPMVFHDIIVDSPYAGVFINGDWDLNFKVLFKPLMGDEKKDEKKVAADEKKAEEKDEDATRVVIDKLDISGTKVQIDTPVPVLKGTIPIPLPTFTDIGKKSKDGATVEEVGEQVLAKAKSVVGPVGTVLEKIVSNPAGNMKELLDIDAVKMLGDAKDFLTAGATNVLGGAKDFVTGGATNVLGGAKDIITGGTTNVLGGAKGLIGGLLPGGDKKDDDKGKDVKKKEDGEPGAQNKSPEESKGLLDKVNPVNLLK